MINFGVIGTSWITGSFIDATKNVEGLNLSSVYSRTEKRANEFAKKYGAKETFTSLEEMAKSDKIDAVYIASPNSLHYEQSKLFLQHKKHVICEKPVAVNGELVKDLLRIAKENNVVFMEAIKGIHLPQQKVIVDAMNKIGKITAAKFDFCQLSSRYEKLKKGEITNIFNPEFKAGCVMDIGIYCIYPALYLFGMYNNISSHALKYKNGIDLCGTSILEYDDKVVTLTYSKVGDGRGVSEIIGDNGTITINKLSDLEGITLYNTDGTTETIYTKDDKVHSMQFEAQSFYNYITDFSKYEKQYNQYNELCVKVSNTLKEIRIKCNMEF